jgi:rRNA-processing protein EBP2
MKRKVKQQHKKTEFEEREEFTPIEEDSDIDGIALSDGDSKSDAGEGEDGPKEPEYKQADFTQVGKYDSKALDIAIEKCKSEFYSSLESKKLIKKQGEVPFNEHMSIVNSGIVLMPENENVHNDLKRELCFYNITLLDTQDVMRVLLKNKIKIGRPNDYFAEMFKDDNHMRKVKAKLLKQDEKIRRFEERKLRVDNKKFRKLFHTFRLALKNS